MFRLIECGNPNLLDAIVDKRRYNNKSDVDFLYRDGKKLCKWCCAKHTPSHKHAYCSDKCRISATIMLKPQCRAGAVYILVRQRFKCAHCKYSWRPIFRDIWKLLRQKMAHQKARGERLGEPLVDYFTAQFFGYFLNGLDYKGGLSRSSLVGHHRGAQIDHIVPIWDNGDTFGLDNLQVLCVECHSHKSARENKTRHALKRIKANGTAK